MHLIVWESLLMTNISGGDALCHLKRAVWKAKSKRANTLEISGVAVAALLLLCTVSMFGLSALWAYRQCRKETSHLLS